MLKQINRDYLLSLNFIEIKIDGREFLKKEYNGILVINKKNEIEDAISVSVYLKEEQNKWIISKCYESANGSKNVISKYFKSKDMQELMHFDLVHHY